MIYIFNGLSFAMLLFVVAAGLNFALGFLGVLNFAHGVLFLLGAYCCYTIVNVTGNFWIALVISPLLICAIGGLLEFIFLRPLYKRHHVYTILLTFGVILVFYDLIKIIWGANFLTVPPPAGLTGAFTVFGKILPYSSVFIIAFGLAVGLAIWLLFTKTKIGKILRAISLDREISAALGFNVPLSGTLTFMLGSFLAGLAGVLSTFKLSFAPGVDATILIYSFAIVVIGGVGSFRGTFVASIIVGILDAFGATYFPQFSMALIFILLVIFLITLPRGLFGREVEHAHVPLAPYIGEITQLLKRWSPVLVSRLSWSLLLVVFIVLPLVLPMYWVYLFTEMLNMALFAISFNILLGFTGLLSFGQASIYSIGAYGLALLMMKLNMPWILAFPASIGLCAAVAVVIGLCVIHRSEIYFAMLTLAFAQLFFTIIYKWTALTGGADGLTGIPSPEMSFAGFDFAVRYPVETYYFFLFFVAASAWVIHKILGSPFGQVLRAIRENPNRTEFLGLNPKKYKLIAFVTAGFFTGICGALAAPLAGTIDPSIAHWSKSAEPVFMTLIGGINTLLGPALGAFIYYALISFIGSITEYWQLFVGSVLIAFVMVFPMGILGYFKKMAYAAFQKVDIL